MSPRAYYHGGVPGLQPGDVLRPPNETGAPSRSPDPEVPKAREDLVYVTSQLEAAVVYAALYPRGRLGHVYEVLPAGGALEEDPGCEVSDRSFACRWAVVRRRVEIGRDLMARIRAEFARRSLPPSASPG